MSYGQNSLSPAQIQYLRVGPKAGLSQQAKKGLISAIDHEKNKQFAGQSSATSTLNKIPKLTYGQYEKTVSNFGVLLNKNYGNQTTIHKIQKFGNIAEKIDKVMINQKDKPIYNEKKNALLKKIKDRSDNRTIIKTAYDYKGQKLFVTMKSFVIETENSNECGLPIPYLRFLLNHVNSSRLIKIIEPALKAEGNQIVVQFQKIQNRASHFSNTESKYQIIPYSFERLGQVLHIGLPYLEFSHGESNFTQKAYILNKQLLDIVETNFDNVGELVEKYLDTNGLDTALKGEVLVQRQIRQNNEEEEADGENDE